MGIFQPALCNRNFWRNIGRLVVEQELSNGNVFNSRAINLLRIQSRAGELNFGSLEWFISRQTQGQKNIWQGNERKGKSRRQKRPAGKQRWLSIIWQLNRLLANQPNMHLLPPIILDCGSQYADPYKQDNRCDEWGVIRIQKQCGGVWVETASLLMCSAEKSRETGQKQRKAKHKSWQLFTSSEKVNQAQSDWKRSVEIFFQLLSKILYPVCMLWYKPSIWSFCCIFYCCCLARSEILSRSVFQQTLTEGKPPCKVILPSNSFF